ncbi:glycoside hydrolase family 36 protein [Kribbella monticola]|uniref:glycoside hydrolase family 36 protein n=1 Tax=Kribbella monticola TaxID=2185285 RepID=UPI000DD3F44B|nr:glycoside hydrolase family 36 protein [Kribbella monticola]
MERIAEIEVDPEQGRVYEHGWQSWSPSTDHPVAGTGHRPASPAAQLMGYRPDVELPAAGFQGEGLLAVSPAPGEPTHVFAAPGPDVVPSIRATLTGTTLVIEADGQVEQHVTSKSLYAALGDWASTFVSAPKEIRPAPTGWCSWYQYYAAVAEADVRENLEAIGEHDLPVDVIQLDDGWQAGVGDWLSVSSRFDPYGTFNLHGHRPRQPLDGLAAITGAIRSAGRRPGVWVAPFIVGSDSNLIRRHPDWAGRSLGPGWKQEFFALDLTKQAARAHLVEVFTELTEYFDYFKLDYLFAGALSGLPLYRETLAEIRATIGDAYLLGCGAPILPSVGLVDAMRVGPDIAPHYEPLTDDLSAYSQRAATLSTVGRAWQHGRFWVNDPDCILARPDVEQRESWAATVATSGGLRCSSDRIAALDEWGLHTARTLLSTAPPPTPFEAPAG